VKQIASIPDILGRRALSAGRLAALGATPDFHHGLLGLSSFEIGAVVIGVPPSRTLDGFPVDEGCEEGLSIESLEAGTKLTVQTANSQYHVTVLNGAVGQVLVVGGQHFPEPTPAVLQGSTAGSSLLKAGWIGVGLHVELRVGPRLVITSRVRSVTVDPPISDP
jgi:hypothetical protein